MGKRKSRRRKREKHPNDDRKHNLESDAREQNQPIPKLSDRKNVKTYMEIAVQVFGALSVILGILGAIFGLYSHYKMAAVWSGSAAIICVVLGSTCWFHDRESKREADSLKPKPADPPSVWPTHVELYDGAWFKTIPVTVNNPNPFPLYFVNILILMNETGVSVDSILTEQGLGTTPGMPILPSAITFTQTDNGKGGGQVILDTIPANGTRTIRLKGTIPIKSSAEISICDFKTTGEVEVFPGNVVDNPPSRPTAPKTNHK